jgi:hypothetical protein
MAFCLFMLRFGRIVNAIYVQQAAVVRIVGSNTTATTVFEGGRQSTKIGSHNALHTKQHLRSHYSSGMEK